MHRILAINKPKGPTSHDVINQIRKITRERRVGHAGTLDPLASGVLVVGIGREATKQLGSIVEKEKEYVATIKLGETSETEDEEGKKIKFPISNFQFPIKSKVQNSIKRFIGQIEQVPPKYSAIKINGKEAYKYARKGKDVEMKPRNVDIHSITIESYKYPFLIIRVVCGPGVYIRSLARDIGEALGTGAYMSDLIRTRVGSFSLEKSITIQDLIKIYSNHSISFSS